jgi:hypothetical protein
VALGYVLVTWGWALSYSDIQARGGIRPVNVKRGSFGIAWLNLRCNVSGTEMITVRPHAVSGYDGISSIQTRRDDDKIYVRVYIGAWPGGHANAEPVSLGWASPGQYTVYYDDPEAEPILIGTVEVPQ